MAKPILDRDLLLGHIAVELNFINPVTLVAAREAWQGQPQKSLGQVLVDRQAITPRTRDVLENLVQLQLAQGVGEEDQAADDPSATDLGVIDNLLARRAPPATDGSFSGPLANAAVFRFRKIKEHAAGALGQVYLARDRELRRKVALKEIKDRYADEPDARSRFLLEAEITGRLEHPGVVPVYGLGRHDNGRPFYAMRFIQGESLDLAIKRLHGPEFAERAPLERSLELRKLLSRFIAVCNTIQYAHDRKIVHRDLKPGNIMLGAYGETLVVDWGLAKVLGSGLISDPSGSIFEPLPKVGGTDTLPGRTVGTITYMSPEQAAGHGDQVGPASDIYSLGATLFTLLTGRASVEDSLSPDQTKVDLHKLRRQVIDGMIHRPRMLKPDLDPALDAICAKAMALKIEDRYLSARELGDDLERWLANEPVSAWHESRRIRLRRWLDRHRPLVSGVAAAMCVGILTLASATLVLSGAQAQLQTRAADAERQRDQALQALDQVAADARTLGAEAPWLMFLAATAQHRAGNPEAARRLFDEARLPADATDGQRRVFERQRRTAAIELGLAPTEKIRVK